MNTKLRIKISTMFDELHACIQSSDFPQAEIVLAKLSLYYHMFDADSQDYYQSAERLLDSPEDFEIMEDEWAEEDDYYEPSEYDEWQSYDPDC